MTFEEYQYKARQTAIYPNVGNNYIYPSFGLFSEAGEVAGKFKKIMRDKNGIIDSEDKLKLCYELGDILWYISNIASELHTDLDDIVEINIAKLFSRKDRGKLQGS